MIVAALGNGNDTVGVIDIVIARGFAFRVRVRTPEVVHGVGYVHGIVPIPERGHDHDLSATIP